MAIDSAQVDQLPRIRADILKAKKSLARADVAGKVGDVATWVAVPATVADALLGLPGVLSGTTTVAAIASLCWRNTAARKYRWAMFGSL